MTRTNVQRWLALSAATMLFVAGCAQSSGATAAPATPAPAATEAPASAAAGSEAPAESMAPTAATCEGSGDQGTVQLMINQWVGAEANVAVAECLLKQMGYDVKTNTLAEEVAWQGFETGEVDVILENWATPISSSSTLLIPSSPRTPVRWACRGSSAGTCRVGWPTSTRTSPTGTT